MTYGIREDTIPVDQACGTETRAVGKRGGVNRAAREVSCFWANCLASARLLLSNRALYHSHHTRGFVRFGDVAGEEGPCHLPPGAVGVFARAASARIGAAPVQLELRGGARAAAAESRHVPLIPSRAAAVGGLRLSDLLAVIFGAQQGTQFGGLRKLDLVKPAFPVRV